LANRHHVLRSSGAKLPITLRAILTRSSILAIGQFPTVLIIINLRVTADVPWFFPVVIIWLSLFWKYLDGWGIPKSTAAIRKQNLRAKNLSPKVWVLSLVGGGIALIATPNALLPDNNHQGASLICL
jgi:hypothetical protein